MLGAFPEIQCVLCLNLITPLRVTSPTHIHNKVPHLSTCIVLLINWYLSAITKSTPLKPGPVWGRLLLPARPTLNPRDGERGLTDVLTSSCHLKIYPVYANFLLISKGQKHQKMVINLNSEPFSAIPSISCVISLWIAFSEVLGAF